MKLSKAIQVLILNEVYHKLKQHFTIKGSVKHDENAGRENVSHTIDGFNVIIYSPDTTIPFTTTQSNNFYVKIENKEGQTLKEDFKLPTPDVIIDELQEFFDKYNLAIDNQKKEEVKQLLKEGKRLSTTIRSNKTDIQIQCPSCDNWETQGVDDPRNHFNSIEFRKWKKNTKEGHERSLHKCENCSISFNVIWDYSNELES